MATFIERHAGALGLPVPARPVSLGEGDTPLLESVVLGPRWGLRRLFLKADHLNPTGSYKDRFIACAVNAMASADQTVCLATSSGNTGSSLAAYGARAGVRVILAINEITPPGKLAQMAAHGARLLRVKGFGVHAEESQRIFERLQALAEGQGLPLLVSAFRWSPEAMRGVSTMAWEIVDQLGAAPDSCFVPVGGGGLLSALALGFADLRADVRMEPVQPRLNDTVVTALRDGREATTPLGSGPPTSISGLSVPTDIDGTRAIAHARATGGRGFLVEDALIREVQAEIYRHEGLAVEPAGAAALAGVRQALDEGRLDPGETVVAILTGQGFKDPGSEQAVAARTPVEDVTADALEEALLATEETDHE